MPIGLHELNEEHKLIRRGYAELDEAIFHGVSSSIIIDISSKLTELMLQHCLHEEEFLAEMAAVCGEESRIELRRNRVRLLALKEELRRGDIYAALHLRAVCRQWLNEHLLVEDIELSPALSQGGTRRAI
jgi:hemerythrin